MMANSVTSIFMRSAMSPSSPSAPIGAVSFLDRSRTVAGPGYSRWLIPPAALAIHLAIGQAYAFSVFNFPLARVIGVTAPAEGDWALHYVGLDIQHRHCFFGIVGGGLRQMVGGRRAAQGNVGLGELLWRRVSRISGRCLVSPDLAVVFGLWRAWRHRAWPGLHFAGVHLDQMVSRPARHVHGPGDHGLRRRRHDRRAAGAGSWITLPRRLPSVLPKPSLPWE